MKFSDIWKAAAGGAAALFKPVGKWANEAIKGTPEKRENVSTLLPGQQPISQQLFDVASGKSGGGVYGTIADYYNKMLSDENTDLDAFMAPEMRRYREQIMPALSEQFAGMGSGGLNSSGFRNAQVAGATDLSERLASLRSQLRQNAIQGLQGIGNTALSNYSQMMTTQPASPGFLEKIAPTIGTIAGTYFGGPQGGVAGNAAGNAAAQYFSNPTSRVGANSSPYGG